MTGHEDDTTREYLRGVARFIPGLLLVALTVGVSMADHLPVPNPGMWQTIAIALPPATLVAAVLTWRSRTHSGPKLLACALLAWGVFSLTNGYLLDPAASRLVGAPLALLDIALVWLGSYAVSGAVVYGIDWPAVDVPEEADIEETDIDHDPGTADD